MAGDAAQTTLQYTLFVNSLVWMNDKPHVMFRDAADMNTAGHEGQLLFRTFNGAVTGKIARRIIFLGMCLWLGCCCFVTE